MALILAEGFDAYGVVGGTTSGYYWLIDSRWTRQAYSAVTYPHVVANAGRRSRPALSCDYNYASSTFSYALCNTGAEHSTLVMGIASKILEEALAVGSYRSPIAWRDAGGNLQISMLRTAAYAIELRTGGPTGNVIATSADSVLTSSTYQFIEWEVVCGASGSTRVWVDGTLVIEETGVNTQGYGSGGLQTLQLCSFHNNGGVAAKAQYWDDLYILDDTGSAPFNARLGDVQVAGHFPTADGTHGDWTSTEASHFEAVNDVDAAFDDEYIESATEGHKDSFTITPSGTTPGILAVEVAGHGYNTGAGTAKVTPFVIIGGVTYSGTEVAMAAGTSDRVSYTWEKNPATNGLWSRTVLAAAEFGFEVTEIT